MIKNHVFFLFILNKKKTFENYCIFINNKYFISRERLVKMFTVSN